MHNEEAPATFFSTLSHFRKGYFQNLLLDHNHLKDSDKKSIFKSPLL